MSKDITYEAFKSSIEKDFESYLQEENKEITFNLNEMEEIIEDYLITVKCEVEHIEIKNHNKKDNLEVAKIILIDYCSILPF